MRKLITYLAALLIAVFQFGCTPFTQGLHGGGNSTTHEKINSFLITPDAGTLVVAGEQHHFIFPLGEPLKSLLQWQGRTKLNPSFGTFTVTQGQAVSGSYTLQANPAQLSPAETQFLLQHGFTQNRTELTYSAGIQGTRYLAGNVKVPQTAYFRQPYELTINEPDGAVTTVGKIALTPLTLLADGVVTLAAAPLVGLWVIGGGY